MRRRLVFVGRELGARARIEDAAGRAGYEVVYGRLPELSDTLTSMTPSVLVVDLDEGGDEAIAAISAARNEGALPESSYGYFSHVDTKLGEKAEAAGVRVIPRGRFWRTLLELLEPRADQS